MTKRRMALLIMAAVLLLALAALWIAGFIQNAKAPGNGAKFVQLEAPDEKG